MLYQSSSLPMRAVLRCGQSDQALPISVRTFQAPTFNYINFVVFLLFDRWEGCWSRQLFRAHFLAPSQCWRIEQCDPKHYSAPSLRRLSNSTCCFILVKSDPIYWAAMAHACRSATTASSVSTPAASLLAHSAAECLFCGVKIASAFNYIILREKCADSTSLSLPYRA